MEELLGDEGEEKVFKILSSNKKIKFEKLIKNWQEIDELQIDIYAETKDKIFFIEVKNWSGSFFYSPNKSFQRQEKIWQQQINRHQKVNENFNSSKEIIYLCFYSLYPLLISTFYISKKCWIWSQNRVLKSLYES
jgi:Holliday junction resolvase-like predicted endonuclease